jgi:penicillin-binding protein 2
MQVQREPWYPGDTISVAIGQGLIAVTPIQMARAISAIATGGSLPRPRFQENERAAAVEIAISPRTLEIVRDAMEQAVRSGTARAATGGKFTAAGKTGTAQVYKHSAGIKSEDLPKEERDHAWFVGYAPADRPRIAFAVVVEHGGHGGVTAAPIARRVLELFFERPPELDPPAEEQAAGSEMEEAIVRAQAAR